MAVYLRADGVDIQWLHEASIARDAESILAPLFALKSQLYSRQKPIFIAATNNCKGAAFELVLHADAVFAGPNASFSLPEVKLGIFPGTSILATLTMQDLAEHLCCTMQLEKHAPIM